MLKPHYEILSAKYGSSNIKFLSADVEYIGMGKLNALKIKLNLGAIPAFYLYKNSELIDSIVTSSQLKLEEFIKSYFVGKAIDHSSSSTYTYQRIVSITEKKTSVKRSVSNKTKRWFARIDNFFKRL